MIRDRTKSLCPACLKKIDAEVSVRGGKVVISKECDVHGKFQCLHAWDDPFMYKKMRALLNKWRDTQIKDATIDVTHHCDMECPFCFDTAQKEPELDYIIKRARDWGNGNILLYGGEPTLRKDLTDIISNIKNAGLGVVLLTNGLSIDTNLAKELDAAGLDGILLQLDSLDDDINKKMRGRALLNEKLRAIEALNGTGIWLSLFVVVAKGMNENQVGDILSLAARKSCRMRAVIFTPLSPEGRPGFERRHLSNNELFEEFEKFGITKQDFVTCTEFEVTLTNFLYGLGVNRKSIALCEAICHAYVENGNIIPLNRLVDLNALTEVLDTSDSLHSFVLNFFKKKVGIDRRVYPLMGALFYNMLKSRVLKETLNDNIRNMFGIVINPSQDRYNADYDFLDTCNLHSDTANKFMPFCENNIFTTGQKDIESLNDEYLYHL